MIPLDDVPRVGGGARPPEIHLGESSPFAPSPRRPLAQRLAPVVRDLHGYRPPSFRRDALAGITVAALAVPSAMAYAELAGLSPVNGLYALLLPTVGYALLGSSRRLVVGPEGTISALLAVTVLSFAAAGSADAAELAAMVALLVGACYLLASVLRLGWVADYFSRPVLIGYIHGVVVVLIIGQLAKLTGIDIAASDPIPQLVEAVERIGEVHGATLAVAAGALAVMLPLRWIAPRFPSALAVVVLGIMLSSALSLEQHGVAVVGEIPQGLPSVRLPSLPMNQVLDLVPAALGLFIVSFADEILTARTYAQRHGERIGAEQELRAMAAANVAAGITQGLPVGASGSRTAVNDSMGARSQIAALLAALAVVAILLFLTGPIAYLPKAVLGAAIVVAAIGLIDLKAWRALAAADRVEVAIAAVTAVGVVVIGVLEAVVVAVGLTILDGVRRSARPGDAVLGYDPVLGRFADVAEHPDARLFPGIVVYRLDDRLFFANAHYVTRRMRDAVRGSPTKPNWLVIDAECIAHIDSTGQEALVRLIKQLHKKHVSLAIARIRDEPRKNLDDAGIVELIGAEHLYPTVHAAVEACSEAEPSRQSERSGGASGGRCNQQIFRSRPPEPRQRKLETARKDRGGVI